MGFVPPCSCAFESVDDLRSWKPSGLEKRTLGVQWRVDHRLVQQVAHSLLCEHFVVLLLWLDQGRAVVVLLLRLDQGRAEVISQYAIDYTPWPWWL